MFKPAQFFLPVIASSFDMGGYTKSCKVYFPSVAMFGSNPLKSLNTGCRKKLDNLGTLNKITFETLLPWHFHRFPNLNLSYYSFFQLRVFQEVRNFYILSLGLYLVLIHTVALCIWRTPGELKWNTLPWEEIGIWEEERPLFCLMIVYFEFQEIIWKKEREMYGFFSPSAHLVSQWHNKYNSICNKKDLTCYIDIRIFYFIFCI